MSKPFIGEKLAVLVANGFTEKHLIMLQKAFLPIGANVRLIGLDQGLVNGWNGTNWGLNFAIDKPLKEALAADYSMLVIPGGQKSIEKLNVTAHTKRFVSNFIDSRKPVVALGEALGILIQIEKIAGRCVAGLPVLKEEAERAGAVWSEENTVVDGNLMTMINIEKESDVEPIMGFLASYYTVNEAA